jgi:hypothetical protein
MAIFFARFESSALYNIDERSQPGRALKAREGKPDISRLSQLIGTISLGNYLSGSQFPHL